MHKFDPPASSHIIHLSPFIWLGCRLHIGETRAQRTEYLKIEDCHLYRINRVLRVFFFGLQVARPLARPNLIDIASLLTMRLHPKKSLQRNMGGNKIHKCFHEISWGRMKLHIFPSTKREDTKKTLGCRLALLHPKPSWIIGCGVALWLWWLSLLMEWSVPVGGIVGVKLRSHLLKGRHQSRSIAYIFVHYRHNTRSEIKEVDMVYRWKLCVWIIR